MNARATSNPTVGVARRCLTPPPGVELAGLGYYLNRTWERVRDDLNATAIVITDGAGSGVALVAVDLMYNDATFTRVVREQASARTSLRPEAICVNFSHSHNAPTAGLIIGGGQRDESYLAFAAQLVAETIVDAWRGRQPARLFTGKSELAGMTFNRARENGPVDTRVSVLRADRLDGKPFAAVVNFHSHCTAHMEVDLRAVSRDWPGEAVDQIENALPGVTALYLQGTAGDVNFRRELNGTERRFEPARALTRAALDAIANAQPLEVASIDAHTRSVILPTRRWTREEIDRDRAEGLYRLATGDTTGWLEGIARVCVNQPERLPLRYDGDVAKAAAAVARFAVEWTDAILEGWERRAETLTTEVQALRIGDVFFCAHQAELFTSLGLEVRRQWPASDLFMLGYSNGSIGYLPDAHDITRGSYAALQSPKFTGQFPFTSEAGVGMVNGLLTALEQVKK